MNSDRTRTALLVIALLMAGCFSFLFAQLDLYRLDLQRPYRHQDDTIYPSPEVLAAASLNYKMVATDLGWINMVIGYGSQLEVGRRLQHVLDNAQTLAHLDPRFRHLYSWAPAVFLASIAEPSFDDLWRVTKFLEFGQKAIPEDGSLSYDAAVNYIGTFSGRTNDQNRLREAEIAIRLLDDALERAQTPSRAALIKAYFEGRRDRTIQKYINYTLGKPWAPWEVEVPSYRTKTDVEQLAQLLLTISDPDVAQTILDELSTQEEDHKAVVERVRRLSGEWDRRYNDDLYRFAPPLVWSTIYSAID